MKEVEVPHWLSALPHAPEFRPTDTEFADPIAYISKIEKEASAFGICKIIPPLPKPSKKYVFANLNKSLVKSAESGLDGNEGRPVGSGVNGGESRAVFTTRQQELGKRVRNGKGVVTMGQTLVSNQVWQSGDLYTLDQFESKAKAFSKSMLGMVKDVSPLVVEAMFWKADSEKPIYIEYANDVPGSGFGEPSGNGSFQYFHKRRRKRVFGRARESTHMKYVVSDVEGSNADMQENGDRCNTSSVVEEVKAHVEFPSISADEDRSVHHPDKSDDITDSEGTAGWKLSNCPWNLQVIARSSGSLTRFMPDDIPGVTSPMVYIGMLFSWFAWHIEDHELHSLNFLHTGSSKTWYSVPGDYAFAFEEVIRTHAYGENVDRLAALRMLGEKTTILSPDLVVASEIPCCRLVQNPGEFVVTFPRAYHIGFSHGFNCGEAANFGTPQWLKVAKAAAVRRAAMNFLPMLSHQQLLYLLTMSFVTRVPRALLVGARSSRLKERIKGEREFTVKKAFIEDIINENQLLSVLCGAKSTYRAVLWDPESLPSLNKELSPLSKFESDMSIVEEFSKAPSQSNHNLLDEMRLYMETVKDQYVDVDDDSFLSDFQVDYGTVACVACGILGFPFMTVVQPSERASLDLRHSVQNKAAVQEEGNLDGSTVQSISALDTSLVSSTMKSDKEWNTSDRFFRPHVFCLEHAIQVQELLETKGGARMLVICHADFQKIKNHVAALAVELESRYKFDMVPLDNASVEDLNLIDRATDEDKEENDEDWSSILGVNLRRCIKMRKNSSSKHVDHALRLFGLPSDINSCSSSSHLKWQHKRSRSRTQILIDSKQSSKCVSTRNRIKKENEVILYKRRKSKSKHILSEPVRNTSENSTVISRDIDNPGVSTSEPDISVNNNEATAPTASPTGDILDHNVENCLSVDGVCVATSDNATDVCSEIHTTGEVFNRFSNASVQHCETSHSPVKIGGKCMAEDDQVRCSNTTSLKDCIECESNIQVDDTIVSVSLVPDPACGIEELVSVEEVYLPENGSGVIDVPCIDELLYSASSDMLEDKATCAVVSGVIPSCDNAEDDSSNQGRHITSPEEADDMNQDSLAPVDDQPVAASKHLSDANTVCSLTKNRDLENISVIMPEKWPSGTKSRKRNRELEQLQEGQYEVGDFIRSPCEGLRPRSKISFTSNETDANVSDFEEPASVKKKSRQTTASTSTSGLLKTEKQLSKEWHSCDLEGCMLTFKAKSELVLHQQNKCHIQGCHKKFTCHRYLIVHQRVHAEDRPLKCSWKGCNMSFKWAWARTEHLRVHTGERPYKCKAEDCGKRFRFISDFSRHRRKTGHAC